MPLENSPSIEIYEQGIPEKTPDPSVKHKRIKIIAVILLVSVLVLGFLSFSSSQAWTILAGKGTVTGKVVEGNGQPVLAEMVILKSKLQNNTLADGTFRFENVPAGDQVLVVGYQGQAVEVRVDIPVGGSVDVGTIKVQSTVTP